MDTTELLASFYGVRDEDNRLESKHGAVEFFITTHYIDQYLKDGDRLLEIGAGTGRYSLHYAHKNFEVDSIELLKDNLDVLRRGILPTDKLSAVRGNALDLAMYKDGTFDVTLVLGPMYHLFTQEDKVKCISEAIRVTKKGGIIFVAYCQFDASMIQAGFLKNQYNFLVENEFLDQTSFTPISNPKAVFELHRKEQIDELMSGFPVSRLHYVGTDMFTQYCREQIDAMDEYLYQKYLEYTLSICEYQNLVGVSNHTLDILRKLG